jgi:hypothetical protein
MKLEYRDLSSSRTERLQRSKRFRLGPLDFFAASLTIFIASAYFVMPAQVERGVDVVLYEPAINSYASIQCIRDKTTRYQFTQSRDVLELRSSVRVLHHSQLGFYAKPQPDAGCLAAHGFVERVPRWDYFFGWLAKKIS